MDTPGIHKPRSPMGERLNATADRRPRRGRRSRPGDRRHRPPRQGRPLRGRPAPARRHLRGQQDRRRLPARDPVPAHQGGGLDLSAYFPMSARTGEGVDELVDAIVARLPEGPSTTRTTWSPTPDDFWVAELVREQLLAVVREEMPHSIACRVTEWEWPRIRCEILVERESQKGIVIGKGGAGPQAGRPDGTDPTGPRASTSSSTSRSTPTGSDSPRPSTAWTTEARSTRSPGRPAGPATAAPSRRARGLRPGPGRRRSPAAPAGPGTERSSSSPAGREC